MKPLKKKDTFEIFNEWLDTCPFEECNYVTVKMCYNPKTKCMEVSFPIPKLKKIHKDYYTDSLAEYYTA